MYFSLKSKSSYCYLECLKTLVDYDCTYGYSKNVLKVSSRASNIVQWVKAFTTILDDLNSIPETHMVGERLPQIVTQPPHGHHGI